MKLLEKNKKVVILGTILLEIVFMFFMYMHYTKRNLYQETFPGTNLIMVSDSIGAMYLEDGIMAYSPSQERLEDAEILSCGPYISLQKGSYDVTIRYKTETDGNRFAITCGTSRDLDSLFANEKDGYLPAASNQITCHLRALKDIEAFDVQTLYYGVGSLTIYGIDIQQTNEAAAPYTLRWAIILLLIDILWIFRKKVAVLFNQENYKFTVGLGMLMVFSSVLVFVFGYYPGHDFNFHLLRIEGLKEAILSGQFLPKLHPTHMRGYGYATGTMYPELFLYIPALLRLLCVDMIDAYKCFIVAINVVTILVAFYSFHKIFKDKTIAFVGTVMYTLAPYRILDLYYRSAVGESCAFIGLPLIAYGLFSFVKEAKTNQEEEKPNWIALGIGYSIIIETHIISIVIVAIFSVMIGLVCMKAFIKKNNIIALVKTMGLTLGLNAWFIVPFLDYFRLPMNRASDSMNTFGVTFAQLFTHQVLSEYPMHSVAFEQGNAGEPPYAIGYAIIVVVALFLIFAKEQNEKRKLGVISFGVGAIACIFALYNFPWDELITKFHIEGILNNIQFPWRFLEIMVIAFVICGCIGIEYASKKIGKPVIILAVCMLAVMDFVPTIDSFIQKNPTRAYVTLNSNELGTLQEYALEGTDTEDLKKEGEKLTPSSDSVKYMEYEKKGTNARLTVVSESDTEQFIDFPMLMYPGYKAVDTESDKVLPVTYGHSNTVRVLIPEHFQGNIQVSFAGKWYWKVAAIMSLLSLVGIIMLKRIKRK